MHPHSHEQEDCNKDIQEGCAVVGHTAGGVARQQGIAERVQHQVHLKLKWKWDRMN